MNQTGPIMTEMPIFMVGIIFGLAMDYEVFLVSRIREAHSHGADARTAIRTVAAGDTLLSPQATRLEVLTAREREIVAFVAHGLSNEEIAERLFVSPYSARTHVHRAMAKLDARDRAQLVVIAYQTGLVVITHDWLAAGIEYADRGPRWRSRDAAAVRR